MPTNLRSLCTLMKIGYRLRIFHIKHPNRFPSKPDRNDVIRDGICTLLGENVSEWHRRNFATSGKHLNCTSLDSKEFTLIPFVTKATVLMPLGSMLLRFRWMFCEHLGVHSYWIWEMYLHERAGDYKIMKSLLNSIATPKWIIMFTSV